MSATQCENPGESDGKIMQLPAIPPFQDLPEPVASAIHKHCELRRYAAGQTIFSAGQYDGDEILTVTSGCMQISQVDGKSGEMVIEDFAGNSVFGLEFAFADLPPESAQRISAIAKTDCALIALAGAPFAVLAHKRPSLMRNIAGYFADELCTKRFDGAAAKSAPEKRVYEALLSFVKRDELNGEWRIERMPKHRELAGKAGVDESEAASALAVLIQEGVARRVYPGLIVNDMGRLNQLAR